MDRISPTRRPEGTAQGSQSWRHLLFLHWPVPVEAVRSKIPPGLSVDTWEGNAWIGVVPFTMQDVRPYRWAPPAPFARNFHELNVRTYVHHEGENPGVWFFSLDAASSLAVLAARVGWHLPYHRAAMELEVDGPNVTYSSERRFPKPVPATLSGSYRIGDALEATEPGTFRFFVAERYILYANPRGEELVSGRVHHPAYPLHEVHDLAIEETMCRVHGFDVQGDPHALYSPGVDVEIFSLETVRRGRRRFSSAPPR